MGDQPQPFDAAGGALAEIGVIPPLGPPKSGATRWLELASVSLLVCLAANVLVRFFIRRSALLQGKGHIIMGGHRRWSIFGFDIAVPNIPHWKVRAEEGEGGRDTSRSATEAFVGYVFLLGSVCMEVGGNFVGKLWLFFHSLVHLVASRELDGLETHIEREQFDHSTANVIGEKTLIFVRHGESVWNFVFNRDFTPSFIFRSLLFFLWETTLLCEPDSVLFDSPLSSTGISQAVALQQWVNSQGVSPGPTPSNVARQGIEGEDLRATVDVGASVLKGTRGNSVLVTSNLRRAISTALVAFGGRLRQHPSETVFMLSCLQEATRNPDGLSLAPFRDVQKTSHLESTMLALGLSNLYASRLDTQFNFGSKHVGGKLLARMQEFANWVFESSGSNTEYVIVCGHSLWFRNFFRTFLPKSASSHIAAKRKIVNCGVVELKLLKLRDAENREDFMVNPNSIRSIYGGFVS